MGTWKKRLPILWGYSEDDFRVLENKAKNKESEKPLKGMLKSKNGNKS